MHVCAVIIQEGVKMYFIFGSHKYEINTNQSFNKYKNIRCSDGLFQCRQTAKMVLYHYITVLYVGTESMFSILYV